MAPVLYEKDQEMSDMPREPYHGHGSQVHNAENQQGHFPEPEPSANRVRKKKGSKKSKRKTAKAFDTQRVEQRVDLAQLCKLDSVSRGIEGDIYARGFEATPADQHGHFDLPFDREQNDTEISAYKARHDAASATSWNEHTIPKQLKPLYGGLHAQQDATMTDHLQSATPMKEPAQRLQAANSPDPRRSDEIKATTGQFQYPGIRSNAPAQVAGMHLGLRVRMPPARSKRAQPLVTPPATRQDPVEDRCGPETLAPSPVLETPAQRQTGLSTDRIADAVRKIIEDIHRGHQDVVAKSQAELKNVEQELEQAHASVGMHKDRAQSLKQEVERLSAEVENQKTRLSGFESKASKFKKFVHGLGNDYASLKKDFEANRARSTELVREGQEQCVARDTLLEQDREYREDAVRLRNEALKSLRDATTELEVANAHLVHLEQQMTEKSRSLEEEKSLRKQTQEQLTSAISVKETLVSEVQANKTAVLDNLSLIHAEFQKAGNQSSIAEQLENTAAAVQSLESRQTATVDDVSSVRTLVKAMSQSLSSSLHNEDHQTDHFAAIKAHMEGVIEGLRADLSKREHIVANETWYREKIANLEGKLQENNEHVLLCKKEMEASKANSIELKQRNDRLHEQVNELQSRPAPDEDTKSQLEAVKVELEIKTAAVEAAQIDLESKSEELRNLTTANAALHADLKVLQERLDSWASPDPSASDAEFSRRLGEGIKQARQEISAQAAAFNESEDVRRRNEVRQLQTSNGRIAKKLRELEQKSTKDRSAFERAQKQYEASKFEWQEKQAATEKLAEERGQEAVSAQSSLDTLKRTVQMEMVQRSEYDVLKAQLVEEEAKARTAEVDRAELAQDIDRLSATAQNDRFELEQRGNDVQRTLSELEQVKHALEQTKTELERQRTAAQSETETLEKRLSEANKVAKLSGEGLEQYKRDSEAHFAKERDQSQKSITNLQNSLAEAEHSLAQQTAADEEFRLQVEQSWNQEQAKYKTSLEQADERVNAAGTERDEALAEAERLRNKIAMMHKRATESQHTRTIRCPGNEMTKTLDEHHGEDAAQAEVLHQIGHGVTPTASFEITQPTRPRKAGDRSAVITSRQDSIPAPDILRTRSIETSAEEPAADRSQGSLAQQTFPAFGAAPDTFSPGRSSLISGPSREESQPSPARDDSGNIDDSQQADVVPETQFDDLPSFARFNAATASLSGPKRNEDAWNKASDTIADPRRRNRASNVATMNEAEIILSANAFLSDTQDAHEALQDDIIWKLPDFGFKKPVPPSNSGSKLIRSASNTFSDSHDVDKSEKTRKDGSRLTYQTPEPRSMLSDGPRVRGPQSSSPDFVSKEQPSRAINTYSGQSSGKRRATSNLGFQQLPKRKATGHAVIGYDQQHKKSAHAITAAQSLDAATQEREFQPVFSQASAFPRSSQDIGSSVDHSQSASQPRTRVRTLAGASARQTRRSKMRSTGKSFPSEACDT